MKWNDLTPEQQAQAREVVKTGHPSNRPADLESTDWAIKGGVVVGWEVGYAPGFSVPRRRGPRRR